MYFFLQNCSLLSNFKDSIFTQVQIKLKKTCISSTPIKHMLSFLNWDCSK